MLSRPIIAVIGGTGKSGQFLVRELIQQGYGFRMLVRDPLSSRIPEEIARGTGDRLIVQDNVRGAGDRLVAQDNVRGTGNRLIVQGDVRDAAAVRRLCEGCQAVISTLGQSKGEPSVFSQATRNVLAAMREHGLRRYIVTTGLNVDTPLDKKGAVTQMGTDWMKAHYPETTADKQLEYALLCASEMDWTLVRLPMIGLSEEGESKGGAGVRESVGVGDGGAIGESGVIRESAGGGESGVIRESLEDCPGSGIHAADLARFLIGQLQDRRYVRQAPFLANS